MTTQVRPLVPMVTCANCEALTANLERLELLAWNAVDGMYGGNAFETLPIETLTDDRKEAFHELLKFLSELRDKSQWTVNHGLD